MMNADEYNKWWLDQLKERKKIPGRAGKLIGRSRGMGAITDDSIDNDVIKSIFKEYGNICVYCGKGGYLEVDHFYPLSRGGHHVRWNLVPACNKCNQDKGCMDPFRFMFHIGNRHLHRKMLERIKEHLELERK